MAHFFIIQNFFNTATQYLTTLYNLEGLVCESGKEVEKCPLHLSIHAGTLR